MPSVKKALEVGQWEAEVGHHSFRSALFCFRRDSTITSMLLLQATAGTKLSPFSLHKTWIVSGTQVLEKNGVSATLGSSDNQVSPPLSKASRWCSSHYVTRLIQNNIGLWEVESKQAGVFESNSSDHIIMAFFFFWMFFTIGPWKVTVHLTGTWETAFLTVSNEVSLSYHTKGLYSTCYL